ncbi:MAG: MFS transporter [Halobacteriales archaeon]|nr:MFS transporter [Halobacteriales archaeon]
MGDPEVSGADAAGELGALSTFRQFFALRRDVLVLSLAMFGFSLAFQMTGRYLPEYLRLLGAGAGIIGLYGSLGNLLGALYPYPGGAISDRIGSRTALTAFGLLSTVGFGLWLAAPALAGLEVAGVSLPAWAWLFVGAVFAQAWKSLGLGATFAVVKQSVPADRLATGFASTETFRRVGFLVGPLLAAGLLAATPRFVDGFQRVLAVALAFGLLATVLQHWRYDASQDTLGKTFGGLGELVADLRSLPSPLRPLLVGDTLVRFANGMVYVFFVIVVTDFLAVGYSAFGVELAPAAFFGVLLGVEMTVALLTMVPVANLARRVGLKPVVGLGFLVYAAFPALLIGAPADAGVLVALFAFSGLRFAGLPAHKALIVGPAESGAGGRVTGAYYLVRNVIVIPSAALGGWLYGQDPTLAFGLASAVGLVGTAYFLGFGEEFEAYA